MQNVEQYVTPYCTFNNTNVPTELYTYDYKENVLILRLTNSSYNGNWTVRVNGPKPADTTFTLYVRDCCIIKPEVRAVRVDCAIFLVELENEPEASAPPSIYLDDEIAPADLYHYNHTQKSLVVYPPREPSTTLWSIAIQTDCGTAVDNFTVNSAGLAV
jgi:hypothetical protein